MSVLRNFLTRRGFERRTRELVTPLYRAARALTGSGADGEALATHTPGPGLLAEASLLRDAIAEAMRSLPAEVRIVVTLFFIEEMKYREIAVVTDCPIGTVMSRIARGRDMLQAALTAGWWPSASSADHRVPEARR